MQVKGSSLLLLSFLFLASGQLFGQTARVVFFQDQAPFSGYLFTHKVKITEASEGQYTRPKTTYGYKYILAGKLTPHTALVYDYTAPTPAFYVGHDKKDQLIPSQPVQFVAIKSMFPFFGARYSFQTYTPQQFKELYEGNARLRMQLLKCGYRSVDELLVVQPAIQPDKDN